MAETNIPKSSTETHPVQTHPVAVAHTQAKPECRLAVAFLTDSSGSITPDDWHTIMKGTADAIRAREVVERDALFGPIAAIGLDFDTAMFTRAGWSMLDTPQAHRIFASTFEETPRMLHSGTNIAYAIDRARESFHDAPCDAAVRVIDVGSDGDDMNLGAIKIARDMFVAEGERDGFKAVINAIPTGETGRCWGESIYQCSSADALRQSVITPDTGGQVYESNSLKEFGRMMALKVAGETAYNTPNEWQPGDLLSPLPTQLAALKLPAPIEK